MCTIEDERTSSSKKWIPRMLDSTSPLAEQTSSSERRLIKGKNGGFCCARYEMLVCVVCVCGVRAHNGDCFDLSFCINLPCALIACLPLSLFFPFAYQALLMVVVAAADVDIPPWEVSQICSYQHCPVICMPPSITNVINPMAHHAATKKTMEDLGPLSLFYSMFMKSLLQLAIAYANHPAYFINKLSV